MRLSPIFPLAWGAGGSIAPPASTGPYWATTIHVAPIGVSPIDVTIIVAAPGKTYSLTPGLVTFRSEDEA